MKEKILEKIRKLFAAAKSEESIGNEAAATLLAEKAQDLLDKYNLSLSDVEIEEERKSEIGFEYVSRSSFQRVQRWQRHLMKVFADLSGCLSIDNGFDLGIVGRERDRKVAIEFYKYFADLANDLADVEMESFCKTILYQMMTFNAAQTAENHRNSFLFGFALRLGDRIEEKHRQAMNGDPADYPQAAPSPTALVPTALIHITRKEHEAREWAQKNMGVAKNPHPENEIFDPAAFYQGASLGEKVALTNKTIKK